MSDATYGMPRIRAELADQGVVASRKRIASVMRHAHIRGVSRRRGYVVATNRDKRQRPAPDLVKRQFVATDINRLWVADMTYVPTWAGFLDLAVVTDVYSRKVAGWAFGANMTADLVIAALDMALLTRKPESVIHHSDHGSQGASVAFGKRLPKKWVSGPAWARSAMPMTTLYRKASLRRWSVSSLIAGSEGRKPWPGWRSSPGLKLGTTRTAGIQVLGQISPINVERLNVQKKEQTEKDAATQKSTGVSDNSASTKTEQSIN